MIIDLAIMALQRSFSVRLRGCLAMSLLVSATSLYAANWNPVDPADLAAQSPKVEKDAHAEVPLASKRYGNLPLAFSANHGQTHAEAKFVAVGRGYSVFLTSTGVVLNGRGGKQGSALRVSMNDVLR